MSKDKPSRDELEVPMCFLDRSDRWNTIKPYNFQYYPKEDFPRHNLQHSPCTTRVRDMHSRIPPVSLDTEGFEVHLLGSKMQHSDFDDDAKVENIYCRELEKHFMQMLEAKHVRALDYQLRRRSPEFPYFGGRLPPRPQPSLMTHVGICPNFSHKHARVHILILFPSDVTPDAAEAIVHELYGDAAAQILQSRYQIITVWKPLRLPVRDWPLAVCDATSLDQADLVPTDIIYPKYVAENCMVHFNENQNWYWLPNQKADEVLVFKAVDSDNPSSWPCAHGAFPLEGQEETTPSRESIDVRLLVMYADMIYPSPKSWSD